MANRKGLNGFTGDNEKNPVKAIRLYCIGCMCGSSFEVGRCSITDCPLFPFRFGNNPYRKAPDLSVEEKARRKVQLFNSREFHEKKPY